MAKNLSGFFDFLKNCSGIDTIRCADRDAYRFYKDGNFLAEYSTFDLLTGKIRAEMFEPKRLEENHGQS